MGRAEQSEGLAMGWSRGDRTVDSGPPRVHRATSSPSVGKLTALTGDTGRGLKRKNIMKC